MTVEQAADGIVNKQNPNMLPNTGHSRREAKSNEDEDDDDFDIDINNNTNKKLMNSKVSLDRQEGNNGQETDIDIQDIGEDI